jgi:hypothetical protein
MILSTHMFASHGPASRERSLMNPLAQRIGFVIVIAASVGLPHLSRGQTKPIASVETNMKATAELYECKRSQGVLTLKVRFKAGAGGARLELPYSATYVVDVAAGKKYFVLRDSDKAPVATTSQIFTDKIQERIEPGATFSAWWKFPAPPHTTKRISFFIPESEPFEDVPITDVP